MQNLYMFIIVILTMRIHVLIGLPVINDDNNVSEQQTRSEENFLPDENFSIVTKDKLLRLQEFANAVHDPKLDELYRAVKHYFQLASKNNEYVLWKYDSHREGLVLTLNQNLNGILYYG